MLATFSYDAMGRRTALTRGNGGVTGYGYDGVSRLASLGHDAPTGGAANDQFFAFTYNPASQILSRSHSNSIFAWTGSQPGTQGYAVNGLNQYTSVGGQAFAYDQRGNLTNDGFAGFVAIGTIASFIEETT